MTQQIQEIDKTYNRIIGALDRKALKNAFDLLQTFIAGNQVYAFQNKLDTLQETYRYMLRYRMEGISDPMQEQIYRQLQADAYELADAIRLEVLTPVSSRTYYAKRRTVALQPPLSFEQCNKQICLLYEGKAHKELEDCQTTLFNGLWTAGFLNAETYDAVRDLIYEPFLPFTTGCQVVSALLMGLQEFFDKKKLLLLFDTANHTDEEIRVRAFIAILITLYTYRQRITLYPQVDERLAALAEAPGFTETVRTIILRFILARETEKITRKLQNEIIPEMLKMSPKISQKLNLKDITPEQFGQEMNPEWENLFADSQLESKIKEFGELQQEGADIMHSTFIHLKHFPFFHETSNWFVPFTTDYSAFNNPVNPIEGTEKQVLETMTFAGFMCNSDKFSLYFSMMQLPKEARKMMMTQFNAEATAMIQQKKEEIIHKYGKTEIIAGQYIQDLYRFFKLYPSHLDFTDIFTLPLDFHNLQALRPYISDKESLTTIAEYYLRKNYFNDALTVFNRLAEADPDNPTLFQKIGYCKEMADDFQGALEAYLHADLLEAGSKWLTRRIAGCYRSLKQPEEALKYYRRYEAMAPDNLSVQISIGHCHLELKDYSEALKCFFKVDYLDSKSHKAWRPIAWCSFLTGKYDQARNYYKKIIAHQPSEQDWLNAGHTEWALQNIKGALYCYEEAVRKANGGFQAFLELFNQDIPDLLIAGIDLSEVPLMLDLLKYIDNGELTIEN